MSFGPCLAGCSGMLVADVLAKTSLRGHRPFTELTGETTPNHLWWRGGSVVNSKVSGHRPLGWKLPVTNGTLKGEVNFFRVVGD